MYLVRVCFSSSYVNATAHSIKEVCVQVFTSIVCYTVSHDDAGPAYGSLQLQGRFVYQVEAGRVKDTPIFMRERICAGAHPE